jgi:phosphotransacetylase
MEISGSFANLLVDPNLEGSGIKFKLNQEFEKAQLNRSLR